MKLRHYDVFEDFEPQNGLKFYFKSEGKANIDNAIHYTPITGFDGVRNFNLGFGVYDTDRKLIDDSIITQNGDVYKVFHTVLHTIPRFFELFPKDSLIVRGSDSGRSFVKHCRQNCTKKCTSYCKNQNRRIRAYRHYVDKNYEDLIEEYTFFGTLKKRMHPSELESYVPKSDYVSILVSKRTN
jgi:hypothetical protein